jgi:hypothetical protein
MPAVLDRPARRAERLPTRDIPATATAHVGESGAKNPHLPAERPRRRRGLSLRVPVSGPRVALGSALLLSHVVNSAIASFANPWPVA